MNTRISVLVVDDHGVVREALSSWLQSAPDIEVVATADNGQDALDKAMQLKPDIVLMDIEMPGLHGLEAARMIKADCPATRVILLSAFHNDRYIDMALRLRVSGYIVKGEPPETVATAIRVVASGGVFFSPEVQGRIVVDAAGSRLAPRGHSRAAKLTQRELEILQYVARGISNKEIARIAGISPRTVERHVENLKKRLDIQHRVELAKFALREGLAAT
jgi:DNA-binding NarL/FixJ family response regulator